MAAKYPTADPSFTTKTDGASSTIYASYVNDLQNEVVAIGADLRTRFPSGQIVFPATQVPSSGANTLDDYEEGTWTPAIKGATSESGQAYSLQVGNYVKVGKRVDVWGTITLSTLGTITGDVEIGELPFASSGTAYMPGAVGNFSGFTANFVFLNGVVLVSGSTRFRLHGLKAAGTGVASLAQGDLSNTTALSFSATYLASA